MSMSVAGRTQNIVNELLEALADRVRRRLKPYPHLEGAPENCHCVHCRIAALSDDDRRFLEANGWVPPKTEVTVYVDRHSKLDYPAIVINRQAHSWQYTQFQTAILGNVTCNITYIPRGCEEPMESHEWGSFTRAVDRSLLGASVDKLAKLSGPPMSQRITVNGHYCTITTEWRVFVDAR